MKLSSSDVLESRLLSLPKLVSVAGPRVISIQSFCSSNCANDNVGFLSSRIFLGVLMTGVDKEVSFVFLCAVRGRAACSQAGR